MRILHVIPSVGARHGGPSVALRLMAEGQAAAGQQVTVATTDDNAGDRLSVPYARPINEAGVTFYYFPRQLRFYTVSGPLQRWLDAEVRNFDVVHIHALFSFSSTVSARAAGRASVPYIVRPLGTLAPYGMRQHARLKRISFALIEGRLLKKASAIHCTSQQEADQIRVAGVQSRIEIIPLGLVLNDAELLRSAAWLQTRAPHLVGRRIVLFLARLDPKKGLELLLEAFAGLHAQRNSVALVVAGTGPGDYTTQLEQAAQSLGINGNVFWAGHLDDTEKRGAFQAADLFVLPSQAENFGIAAVEALAAGVPVVLSDQVGVHDAVTRAGAGLVVSREVGLLRAAIDRLLGDDALRAQQARNARTLARTHFSQDAMTQRLLALYQSLLR